MDDSYFWAQIIVGVDTVIHALHTIPMWAAACDHVDSDCTTFYNLAFGNVIAFGFQAIVWPFTFVKDEKFNKARRIYTVTQDALSFALGWGSTLFNIIWFLYHQFTTDVSYWRLFGPYLGTEAVLWTTYYIYKKKAFAYLYNEN